MRVLMIAVAAAGCAANREVVPVQNVERTVSVWSGDAATGRHHLCTEYVTPAERLNTNKGSLAIPIGDKGVNVSYEHAESLATIYTVTEIMQFGQMALFRLCEAAGNDMIKKDEYVSTFNATVLGVGELLQSQLKRDQFAVQTHLIRLVDKMVDLDRQRCDAAADATVSAKTRRDELGDQRKRVRQEFVELRQSVDASNILKEPKEPTLPSAEQADAFEKAVNDYLTKSSEHTEAKCREARTKYEPLRACAELDSTVSTRAASLLKRLEDEKCP
jgi:hypothetical protein